MTAPATTKTDLLLLGLLLERPMHGYELYQQIQGEGIDRWFNISAAGVYYSLRKLRDQEWVIESRQQRSGSSRKSIYHLTDEGRTAFFEAMEVELASQEETCLEYDLVIYLLNRFPRERAIPQLRKRQAFLADLGQQVEALLEGGRAQDISPLVQAILEHKRRFLNMEQSWLAGVLKGIHEQEPGAGQELMVLNGDLRDLHLPDLFHLIVSGQHSGTLTVSDGAEVRTLAFKDGQPLHGSYLHQGKPPHPLTSCDEVLESLCEIFGWRGGQFTFQQRIVQEEWSVSLDCSAEELILRGCRRVDDWSTIQKLVPGADTIFELGSGYGRLDRLSLTQTEAQVVRAVDGVKDVATIARELDLTLFEISRSMYCLTAISVLRTAGLDKIHLRRVFREIAELMCQRTLAWRPAPDDWACEEEVNERTSHLPIHLNHGRVEDEANPQLETDDLKEIYADFLQQQYRVIGHRFGQGNARDALEKTLRQLPPELQRVARRYEFDRITNH